MYTLLDTHTQGHYLITETCIFNLRPYNPNIYPNYQNQMIPGVVNPYNNTYQMGFRNPQIVNFGNPNLNVPAVNSSSILNASNKQLNYL